MMPTIKLNGCIRSSKSSIDAEPKTWKEERRLKLI
jgi:hypothetical protein